MSIFASFHGFKCPECGYMIVASSIMRKGEPELAVTKCEYCQAELQVSKDPATGKMRAERVKKN
jgi:transcription elongation factor Elf1